MSSSAQIIANQQNAQHSTGPRTPEGIAACRHNATKHGLSGKQIVISGEDHDAYDALRLRTIEQYQPATEAEAMLVEQLAQNWWKLQRAARLEPEIQRELGATAIYTDETSMKKWALFLRHRNAVERSWRHALQQLEKLQRERASDRSHQPTPKSQPASESTRPAAPLPPEFGSVLARAKAFTKMYPMVPLRSGSKRRAA